MRNLTALIENIKNNIPTLLFNRQNKKKTLRIKRNIDYELVADRENCFYDFNAKITSEISFAFFKSTQKASKEILVNHRIFCHRKSKIIWLHVLAIGYKYSYYIHFTTKMNSAFELK